MRGHCRLLLAAACFTAAALAQTDAGRIAGSVTDESGAPVPRATIEVTSEKSGEARSAVTNIRGQYTVENLLPASYSVAANSPGMSPSAIRGVLIAVGRERTVNLVLKPAPFQTEILVAPPDFDAVDTSSASIGVNISPREIAQLPLNGRQLSQLYLLSPGAVNTGSGTFDDVRFSGRSNKQNIIRYDGVEGSSIVDSSPSSLNGETASQFRLQTSLENVQEFRIDSSNYPAEYGMGLGAQVSVVTKSGANEFHGSLYEYLRNGAFDARNFFDEQQSQLRLNQFGGSAGGPLVKDRAFFFASYEGLRQRIGNPFVESTPSAAARARAVPAVRPLLAAFPIGQSPSPDNPDFDIASATLPEKVNEDAGSVRFDYNFSSHYKAYLRYFRTQGDSLTPLDVTNSDLLVTAVPQNLVANVTQVYSSSTVNETKLGFNGYKSRTYGLAPQAPGLDLSRVAISITGGVALPGIPDQGGGAGAATPSGLVRANNATNGRGNNFTNYTLALVDNLSVIRGAHNMKFGGEIRPVRLYNDRLGGTTYSFANLNDFLANRPSEIQFIGDLSAPSPWDGGDGKPGVREAIQTYFAFYGQDEWRVRRNVTINYGLRYEYYTVPREAKNRAVILDILTGALKPPNTPMYRSSKRNFGPRLAISWAPERFGGRTVFRIGGGYYYGPGQTEDMFSNIESDRIATTLSGAGLAYPIDPAAIVANFNINSPDLRYQPRAYGAGYTVPEKVLAYTASVQQMLPGSLLLNVAYVGSQGRNLFLRGITNKITGVSTDPVTGAAIITREFGDRFAEVDYKDSGGTDYYNSLQTTLSRRFATGLSLGAQYTWGHGIGTSGGSDEVRTTNNNYSFAANRGSSDYDIRQSFNLMTLYELPVGRGRRFGTGFSPAADLLLGGWNVGGIVNARSGVPIEVLINRQDVVYRNKLTGAISDNPVIAPDGAILTEAIINVPGGGNSQDVRRPDLVLGADPYLRSGGLAFLNPAAFRVPQPGTFGNLARNAFHGPNLVQADVTLSKKFTINERRNIEFRGEIYNLFNHANFANPPSRLAPTLGVGGAAVQPGQALSAATAGAPFGIINAIVSDEIGQGTNRQIQLALRFHF